MEILVFILVVAVLGVAAIRLGHDSRPTAYSKDEESAALGVASWRHQPSSAQPSSKRSWELKRRFGFRSKPRRSTPV